MGLDISVKGLERKDTYHCGYVTFNLYRKNVASAYNERLGELYKKTFKDELQPEEIKEWNNLCNDDLDILLRRILDDNVYYATMEDCNCMYLKW